MQKEKEIIWFSQSRRMHIVLRTLGGLLLLGLAFVGALRLQRWGYDPTIASTPMLLLIALVALFWGTVPALVMLLASTIALDYLVLDPVGTFHFPTWKVLLQLCPFLLSGGIIALLTAQREHARHLAERAARSAEHAADEIEQDTILEEMALSLTADAFQEKITVLAEYTATLAAERMLIASGASQSRKEEVLSQTVSDQIKVLQQLLADLPELKSIHSRMLFFNRASPHDLYKITQAVIEELQKSGGRNIILDISPASVLVKQDAEYIFIAIFSLLQHVSGGFPGSEGIFVHVDGDETKCSIQVGGPRAVAELEPLAPIKWGVLREQSDLWWVICQACMKRQKGQLSFQEREESWTLTFFQDEI